MNQFSLSWTFAVRALRSHNYRLFFGGQSISVIGTWMTRLATSWLVYRATGSAFLLGLSGFASQIPAFFLAPLAGVWIDRWNRRRTLLATQFLSMLQSFALAALALSGFINIWAIMALLLFQGVINAIDMPARQSFVVQMIEDRADLPNAIALNSSMVNGARLIGPSLAGLIIAMTNEGYCFLIDGLSYLAVIASLLALNVSREKPGVATRPLWHELKHGFTAVSSPQLGSILLLLGFVSLVGMPYSVLMPMIAGKVLHGGPHTLGFLMGAAGVGALAAAIALAVRQTILGLDKLIPISATVFGVALIGVGLSRNVWLTLPLMLLAGFGMMQQLAASNTILQTVSGDQERGRVMSFYTMAVVGITPFGSLLAGAAAARIGAPETLRWGGFCCLLGAALFAWNLPRLRRAIHPAPARLGVIPEIATSLQAASSLQVLDE